MGKKEKGYSVDILRLKSVAPQQIFSPIFELTRIYTRNTKMGLLMSTKHPCAAVFTSCAGVPFFIHLYEKGEYSWLKNSPTKNGSKR